MLDISALSEFSRSHCIAICAVLVPINLLTTLQTMLWVWFRRPTTQIQGMAAIASFFALILILHVITWLAIGVVMAPTYILSFLGGLCIAINLSCVVISARRDQQARRHHQTMRVSG
ncbi:MAG: hypothetical protein KME15_04630 [Drouetiella hepatica Uher 2000/2452]|jgi:hypothetical protein|uniref:Uncharacterized protein n=1 Tax=Drouetiella hepatica Uher 2000/2452 TaxID=904376 RepID=A0A951ULD2_9CYAN|nr:hypothetical protein [Drouetiella hepatica Uher 2000/2452]